MATPPRRGISVSGSGAKGEPVAVMDPPRSRWRWVWVYVVLLIASAGFQWANNLLERAQSDKGVIATPGYFRDGSADEKQARLVYNDSDQHDVSRPTLILLHGSPGKKENFDLLTPELKKHFRVIAPDLPGFGASTANIPSYSTRAHARYVLTLMDELEIETAHVLGFSMGSGVALNLHDLAPDRIDSLIFYGGIGIQEGEGSGDYTFEHLKYTLGYVPVVLLPELVPHFGLLGSFSGRRAFIRNFNDTDQRPMRGYLQAVDQSGLPLLILHGKRDPLVPAWTAEQHHDIVQNSELVMFNRSHFMVFDEAGVEMLAGEIVPFVSQFAQSDAVAQRRTIYHAGTDVVHGRVLPMDLDIPRGTSPWVAIASIMGATYILEDPTTITVGLLVRDGELDVFVALFAVFLGIFTGDLGMYLCGWFFGKRALAWKPVARHLPVHHVNALGHWFDTHGWKAVLASRFVPGTRLPLYVSAGALGKKPWRFALWTFMAVSIWAPVMLMIVILLGEAATSPFKLLFGHGWMALIAAVVALLVVARVLMHLPTKRGRQKLWVKISTLWRWEFWPAWIFYLPLLPWLAWLTLRYRSLTVWTLANPGLPDGGVVGESKFEIMAALSAPDDPRVLQATLVNDADDARREMQERGWSLPLILKPDAAQRGAGVRLIQTDEHFDAYFADSPGQALLQAYHRGPHEAGVFYIRMPDEPCGRIFSITDKQFPIIIGDGQSTLEELIWAHPRYRMQAEVFVRRFEDDDDRILDNGETLRLAMAGNHCQGTLFKDGAQLITPQLEAAIDNVIQRLDGFYFGRLDARYTDAESFKRGEGFAILELNGVTSESTNLYDPSWSIFRAYRTLFKQWSLCFAIGHANRHRLEESPPGAWELWRETRRYYKNNKIDPLAD